LKTIPQAWLEGKTDPVAGLRFALDETTASLGRAPVCQLQISDPRVSPRHAEIRYQAGSFVIRDLESDNGTQINGQPVIEARLADGDRLRLGDSEFIYHLGQYLSPTEIASPAALQKESEQPQNKPAQPGPAALLAEAPASPDPVTPPNPPPVSTASRPKRSNCSRLAVLGGVLAVLVLCACVGCYALSSWSAFNTSTDSSAAAEPPDLQSAMAIETPDERPEVLARLGRPDVFIISDLQVDGGHVRRESWLYHQFGLQIDFVDGQIAWTVDLDLPVGGALFPAWYNPLDFEIGMSMDEAARLAASSSPAGTPPVQFDWSAGGEDLAGVVALAGDQILMGFHQDRLVYIETMALLPQGGEP
jgi:hypothetical protein